MGSARPRLTGDARRPRHSTPYALTVADPADYRVAFTAEERARLRAIFPGGVCDWSRPGAGQQPPAGTWLSFGPP